MADDWPRLSLRDAGVSLIDCDHRTPTASEIGYPYIAIPQIRDGRIDVTNARRISREQLIEWIRKAKPTANDVVLSRRCNPGETAFVPPDLECALGQNLVLLRSDGSTVHAPFLRWLVQGPDWWEQVGKFLNVGAVFDSLKCADIPKFELRIPPLKDQRSIAHILGTLDAKLELNRQMNRTLETTARALFQSWFVDFAPVRAKAEGRPLTLPQYLSDLFPDRLVGSDLGEIPNGWTLQSLDSVAQFVNGLPLQKYPVHEGRSLPVIKIAQLRAGNTDGADLASAELDAGFIVDDGDVLFSWSGSLECVLWAGGRGALNQHIFKVTSPTHPKWLFYLWIHKHLTGFRHIAAGKATTMGHIQRHHLSDAKVVLPPPELLQAIDGIFARMIDALWQRGVESRSLGNLRDTLLPALLSGEMRLRDANRLVEAAIA